MQPTWTLFKHLRRKHGQEGLPLLKQPVWEGTLQAQLGQLGIQAMWYLALLVHSACSDAYASV